MLQSQTVLLGNGGSVKSVAIFMGFSRREKAEVMRPIAFEHNEEIP